MPPHALLTQARLELGLAHLRRVDPEFGVWIDRMVEEIGPPTLRHQPCRFTALARSIVGQQLSAKAARTIFGRLLAQAARTGARLDPALVLDLDDATIRGCGLSVRKAASIRTLAKTFHSGPLRRARLQLLEDEAVIDRLVEFPGVGRWTAEMFLLFALRRPDVFSLGDSALRASAERVAGGPLAPEELLARAAIWTPFRSVASLCLWRLLELPRRGR